MEQSLLEKIKASGKKKKETNWPGTNNRINLRILTDGDYLASTMATDALFKGTPVVLQNIDRYNSELETQYLFRAIEDPETDKQLFTNITDFRDSLIPEVKEVLSTELDALHEEYSPNPITMSDEAFDKLVDDIKKNAEETVGSVSNIFIARKLIIYLVKPKKK